MQLIDERPSNLSLCAAMHVIQFPKATYYRLKKRVPERALKKSSRALNLFERQRILDTVHSERFMDAAPGQVVAELLDEGLYIGSERTIYRVLSDHKEVGDRRRQRKHPVYHKPELLASGPNQLWSWDITKLRGPVRLEYYQLYVILDVFSRYVVGWLLARNESAELAKKLIRESCDRQNIGEDQLTIHSDRGPAMKSQTVAELLVQLSVLKSHSRPHVSNDNPYSESQFKTMKYGLSYPERFGSFEDAQSFCRNFFDWYNNVHRHSGLQMLTPADVHFKRSEQRLKKRHEVMLSVYEQNPNRFVAGTPKQKELPNEVWINPPQNISDTGREHLIGLEPVFLKNDLSVCVPSVISERTEIISQVTGGLSFP